MAIIFTLMQKHSPGADSAERIGFVALLRFQQKKEKKKKVEKK